MEDGEGDSFSAPTNKSFIVGLDEDFNILVNSVEQRDPLKTRVALVTIVGISIFEGVVGKMISKIFTKATITYLSIFFSHPLEI